MYCERANDYNRYGPIARTEYKMCKKDIGELSEISLDTIKGWIARDRLNGFEIKAKLFCRAEALRYRLEDELHHSDVASVPDIRDRCRDFDDEQVFAYYRDKESNLPQG